MRVGGGAIALADEASDTGITLPVDGCSTSSSSSTSAVNDAKRRFRAPSEVMLYCLCYAENYSENSMSNESGMPTTGSDEVPTTRPRTAPALRREGALAIGATALGALALGALAMSAVAIGKIAIGQLSMGRARLRHGRADDLHIARLTIAELRIDRFLGPKHPSE